MLKFLSTSTDGRLAIWLGLTDEELVRLPTEPILLELAELNVSEAELFHARLVILSGPTKAVIAERLEAMGLDWVRR